MLEVKRRGARVILNSLYKLADAKTLRHHSAAIVDNQPKGEPPKCCGCSSITWGGDHPPHAFDLRKAEERAHILEGLLKALDHLDQVIATIRSSQTPSEAKERLMSGFAFSDVQAQAILDMQLQRLTGLERQKIVDEYKELMTLIERLRAILASDKLVLEEIRRELAAIKAAYGDKRRTEIIPETNEITLEDMIADEDMVITITNSGYIKRSPLSLYRAQGRGGRTATACRPRTGTSVERLYVASAHRLRADFTESGVHWIKVYSDIPQAGPRQGARAIIQPAESSRARRSRPRSRCAFPEDKFLVFATRNSTIRRPSRRVRQPTGGRHHRDQHRGRRSTARRPGHRRRKEITPRDAERILDQVPGEGRPCDDRSRHQWRARHRSARSRPGVSGWKPSRRRNDILTVCENAYGKRTETGEYRVQSRGGLGIINLKISKTGRSWA